MKILVTGGAGNIGGSLCRRLVKNSNYHVDIIDDLSTGSELKLPSLNYKNWNFYKCDINDNPKFQKIVSSKNYDYVFHYAAVVGVQRTLSNPKLVLNDIEGIKNILNYSANNKVKKIFFSSSSEVYGEPVEIPQRENTTPLNSKLPYAVVKNIAESFFKSYHQEDNLNYVIFRFFNTYGPLQSDDFVITKFIKQAVDNKNITIYGDGTQTRTFCYIDDNIDVAINTMLKKEYTNEIINVGSDYEIKIIDLAKLIIKLTKSKSEIIFLPPLEEGDMTRRKPDISKMRSILNKKLIDLEEGILRTVKQLNNY